MTDRALDRHLAPVLDEPPPDDGYVPSDWTPPRNGHDAAPTLHDHEAERDVLAGILSDPTTLDEVTLLVTAEDFHQPNNELIFDAIVALYSTTRPVDVTTVANQLAGDLRRIGGRSTLEELNLRGTAIIDPGYHAEIVKDFAARRRLDSVGTRIKQLAATSRDTSSTLELIDAAAAEVEAIPRTVPGVELGNRSSWAPVDLASIIEHGEVLQQPTILARTDGQCLIYEQAVHSLSGEPESGKSWVALIACAQALRDTDEHVTYVDFEDRAGRVIARLVHLGVPAQAILERFHYIRPAQALDAPGRKILDEHLTVSSVAIIDGVTEAMTMHGLSLMDNEDAARYLGLLPRHMADLGPGVLQIDHVVKDSEKQGRWAIGAGHKLAGLDGAAYGIKVLEPFGRGKIGRAAIAVHKDREGAVREIALGNAVAHLVIDSRGDSMSAYLEEPTTMPKSADGAGRPTHLMEKVSRYVEVTPGASQTDIEKSVTGKVQYLRMAVNALVAEGYLAVTAGPRNTRNHSIIAVFREDESDAG